MFGQICQLWCFPLLHWIPGPRECKCVLRVWETEKVHRGWQLRMHVWTGCGWLTQWWCGQRDPGCHAHMYAHTNTHTCKHTNTKLPAPGILPTVTPGSNIIISPPGWFEGIRGLQREREGEKRPDLIPSCLETWLSWGRLFFGMQQTLWDPPPLPLLPSPINN